MLAAWVKPDSEEMRLHVELRQREQIESGMAARAMMERYSHIRMEAKRKAVDTLSGTDFEPGVAQNWAQFFVSEKPEEANSLKTDGEPGRTRTCNPLSPHQTLSC